ncbi:MAG: DUF3520 domain-containing protein [Chloroflexi bacterium]|nr:DUF3520 domain-containing protein [Chloroflexota bacterium]
MNKQRTLAALRVRRITLPLIALATLAAAILSVACADDAQQAESEQPTRVAQTVEQVEQQQAMEQQAAQQESYAMVDQQQTAQTAVAEYEHQQQAEQEAMQEQAQQEQAAAYPSSGGGQSQQETSTFRPSPGATTFEDYPTIGWRVTVDDDTSTFSLDVDRTSYFLALNWVEAGYAIEPASVRAEEWINAFDYHYDLPDVDDSFAVTTDILEHPLHDDLHLVRIATQAPEFVDDTPLNVTLVLDASGSMQEGNRVEIARAAAESIRSGLGSDDRIAVVLFSDSIVDSESHQPPDDRDIRRIIERLRPTGSTNVQAGLNLGVRFADEIRRERPNAHNHVVLMSDGVANVDATDPFAILRTAEDRDDSNPLRLITVGVGIANYNDVLLEQLAQYGNGWYRYLQDVNQARSTFSRENWLALSVPFADQARAQVRWDHESVAAWRLVGYENRVTADHNFEQDRKEFAEIPMGSATTVFFEVELSDTAISKGLVDLGEVELRWLTPMSSESNRQQVWMVSSISRFGDDGFLDLGSVVALAADRYSWFGQDGLSGETMALAADHIRELASRFANLPEDIVNSRAAVDFGKLLFSMGAIAGGHESENPGYSR